MSVYGCFAFYHAIIATIYGLYYFSSTSSIYTITCVTNQVQYTPYAFNSSQDLELYMNKPGSSNVSESFQDVIAFGFYS